MPLQLVPIFYLISLLLPRTLSTDLIAKPRCQDRCGSLSIPYPFRVGSGCSRDSFFTINCNTSTHPPKPYLTIINKEVIEINQTYIRVKYPNLVSTCYDHSSDSRGTESFRYYGLVRNSVSLSPLNLVTAIGCDDVMLLTNRSSVSGGEGGCSAICGDRSEVGVAGYCPVNVFSLGNGCCQVEINPGKKFIGAQLSDLSGTLLRRRLLPCSYAFIQERNPNETAFSYPLYYLDNYTAMLNDNWASATRPPVVRLDWIVGGGRIVSELS